MLSRFATVAIIMTVLIGLAAPMALAYTLMDPDQVYLGDPDESRNPAVIQGTKVFEAIPEYQQIVKRGLDDDDAEFWILLNRANEKFRDAVAAAAGGEYDLVVEKNALVADEGEAELEDLTQAAIDSL